MEVTDAMQRQAKERRQAKPYTKMLDIGGEAIIVTKAAPHLRLGVRLSRRTGGVEPYQVVTPQPNHGDGWTYRRPPEICVDSVERVGDSKARVKIRIVQIYG